MKTFFGEIPTDPVIDRFVDLSFEISEKIIRLLREKKITQRELASKLNKKESEISKWLRGEHNFTLKTIAAVEVALDEKFIQVHGLDQDYFIINGKDGQLKYVSAEDLIPSRAVSNREKGSHVLGEKTNRLESPGYVLHETTSISLAHD